MKIRGDLKIYSDVYAPNTGDTTPLDSRIISTYGSDGKLIWKDVFIPVAENRVYAKGSVVLDSNREYIHIALDDDAPGNNLIDVKWGILGGDSGGGTGSDVYDISTDIPNNAPVENVGGVRNTFKHASAFKDIDGIPNKTVSEVLDSILFKDTPATPTPGDFTMKLLGKYGSSSSYVDITDKVFEYGKLMDIQLDVSFINGSWSDGSLFYGNASHYSYIVEGITVPPIPIENSSSDPYFFTATNPLSPFGDYDYKAFADYLAGGEPHTSQGNLQMCESTGLPCQEDPGRLAADTKSFSASAPILVAMLSEQKIDEIELRSYLNDFNIQQQFSRIVEPATSFLQLTPVTSAITSYVSGDIKYPYVLIPSSHATSLKEFKDYKTNTDYTYNFLSPISVYIGFNYPGGDVLYDVYMFNSFTSINTNDNNIKLTIN
ncbi:MAG: hypothetical protein KAH32_03820 [Chlamydiia bacterium]|nr:hypothetical protein [Chlamydiia bacterium]